MTSCTHLVFLLPSPSPSGPKPPQPWAMLTVQAAASGLLSSCGAAGSWMRFGHEDEVPSAQLGGGDWKRQIWCARRRGLGGGAGELVHVLHHEQPREDPLPLGKDRLDAFHYASLVGMHMYEWRTLMRVHMHVHGRRWRETYALSCLEDRLMPMVPGNWDDWSASPDGTAVRRRRSLSVARTGLVPAVQTRHKPSSVRGPRCRPSPLPIFFWPPLLPMAVRSWRGCSHRGNLAGRSDELLVAGATHSRLSSPAYLVPKTLLRH